MKVAAVCGSLRRASCNRGLIRCAVELCDDESVEGMKVELVEIEALPFVNTDLEVNGDYPRVIDAFRQRILEADCILFAFPEYNYSLPAALKNAIDWASRPPNVWADKAAAIVSASGSSGGRTSQYHLRQVGVFIDLHFINKPEMFIVAREAPNKFDDEGNLIDPVTKEQMKQLLLSLQAFTLRLQEHRSPPLSFRQRSPAVLSKDKRQAIRRPSSPSLALTTTVVDVGRKSPSLEACPLETSSYAIVPQIGMIFNSEEKIREFYRNYAKKEGFRIAKTHGKKDDEGVQRYFCLSCSRNGRHVPRGNRLKNRASMKTGCGAKINVLVKHGGICSISQVFLEHNHELSPK